MHRSCRSAGDRVNPATAAGSRTPHRPQACEGIFGRFLTFSCARDVISKIPLDCFKRKAPAAASGCAEKARPGGSPSRGRGDYAGSRQHRDKSGPDIGLSLPMSGGCPRGAGAGPLGIAHAGGSSSLSCRSHPGRQSRCGSRRILGWRLAVRLACAPRSRKLYFIITALPRVRIILYAVKCIKMAHAGVILFISHTIYRP